MKRTMPRQRIQKVEQPKAERLAQLVPPHHLVAVAVEEITEATKPSEVEASVTFVPVEITITMKAESAVIFVVVPAAIKLAAAILAVSIAVVAAATMAVVEATLTAVIAVAVKVAVEGFSRLSKRNNTGRSERRDSHTNRLDTGNPRSLVITTVTVKYKNTGDTREAKRMVMGITSKQIVEFSVTLQE